MSNQSSIVKTSALAAPLVVVGLLAVPSAANEQLHWRQNPSNGHWYGAPFVKRTWSAGEALAQQLGGHLATVRDAGESAWLGTQVVDVTANGCWIGLNDLAVEGTFVWTSGEAVTYTNWAPGEPNNADNQDGAKVLAGTPWRWDDVQTGVYDFVPIVEVQEAPHDGWTFPNRVAVQTQPGSFAIGDWNEDGKLDLAVPNRVASKVSMLLGTGDGSFQTPQTFATRTNPESVAAADFNLDGHLDLAVACSTAQQVRVYFGDGSGALIGVATLATTGKPAHVVAQDFDGDLDPDLAVTTTETLDELLVYRNVGVAQFAPPDAYATGARPTHVTAADVDADGDRDLVVACYDADLVSIYANAGNGQFASLGSAAGGNGPGHVAVADLDGDGHVDLAVPSQLDGIVALLWGAGDGTFGAGGALQAGGQASWIAADDLDGDALQDFVVANAASASATVYYGRGLGAFDGPYDLFTGSGSACIAPGDFDGDGVLDLAFTARTGAAAGTLLRVYRDCNANGRIDATDLRLGTSLDSNANQIPDECEVAGVPFCFGDGSGIACPCGPSQAGASGHGCANSAGSSGLLTAEGLASVAADSVTLRATDLTPTAAGLFFQGTAQPGGGQGTPFGDGLVCVSQNVIRLAVRTASAGAMSFGHAVGGDPSIASAGNLPAGGATRFYQVWYRDAATFCTSSTFNLTNGLAIAWLP